ncbi:hypothetical protein AN963_00975 [Brevibacillus choshinensis]|uniref:Uncharacterized protein n=2 Tax=Brevibacillus choshinensis TaxID=54911 RepID=A0ABR5NEV1_BRECH|nr:hypothetical protein AN963_00975 [Brevibacillus choshinensis]
MKLCVTAGIAFGLLMGVFQFAMTLLNWTAQATQASFGSISLTGIPAAILILIFIPLRYGFFGVIFSMISYFPMMFLLRKIKGITLEGVFEGEEAKKEEGVSKDS